MPNTDRPIKSADLLISAARSWIGTPYRHQGRLRGHAVDCVGVVIEAALETGVLGVSRETFDQRFRPFQGYGRLPRPLLVRRALATFMVEVEHAREGDVAFLRWDRGPPMHLAFLARHDGRLTMIHAHGWVGRCVEHGFDAEWPGRVDSWWRFPLLDQA